MAKRQKRTVGSIVKIPLKNGYYAYAQILDKASYAFFDYFSETPIEELEILNNVPVLYVLSAYNDIVTKGRWEKIGKLPVRDELNVLPMQFIQDALNPKKFELYNPNTGEITPTTKEECSGLEQAAVWEGWEVEDRLLDHFEKKPDKTLEEYRKIFS